MGRTQVSNGIEVTGSTSCLLAETLAEEMPDAYKDISQVIEVVHGAGISKKVAKLRPMAVLKG